MHGGATAGSPGSPRGIALLLAALALLGPAPASRADETRHAQSIVFPELPPRSVGDDPFPLVAKASSGLAVSFQVVDGPAVLDGKNLRLTESPGLVIVRASQEGNPAFAPAKPEVRAFSVNPRPSAPAFFTQPVSVRAELGSIIVLTAAVSGYPAPALQWRKDGVALAGETDRTLTIPAAGLAAQGSYDLVASNPSGSLGSSRAQVQVTKRRQFIAFQGPTSAVAGQPLPVGASASSGLPVRLEVLSGSATLSGGTLLSQAGIVVLQASQAGDSVSEPAADATEMITVGPPPSGQRLP